MKMLVFLVFAAILMSPGAFAEGTPAAGAPTDNTVVFVCQPSATHTCTTGMPWSQALATMPDLVTYLASRLPAAGNVNVIIMAGNNTGTYTVPAMTAANKLLLGFTLKDDLSTTTFNWSTASFVLGTNLINPTNGWHTAAGQVIDPTKKDWTSFNLVFLYE
jgi:hypothetical protein